MRVASLLLLALLLSAAPAAAQSPPRLAAPADCLTNPGCGVGLAARYGADVRPVLVPLTVPDAGIAALDAGEAEVAVAFSTDPEVSRPDILTLADDKGMVGADRLVPVLRRSLLRAYGRRAGALRARFDRVSRLLTTLQLRALNQQVSDGRLPEAVGGEWVESFGLGTQRRRRPGPRVTFGFQAFAESETVAHLYGAALRAAGYRVRVRPVGGLRAEAVSALRAGRVDGFVGYARSLARALGPEPGDAVRPALQAALRRRAGAVALQLAPGENRNLFVMKRLTATALGIASLSDLARRWPTT